ncbi:WcaI family glycosyltransferase [Altererythrobacter luteolus]|uniref:WcaI family glycosyltransferase n=1 Tax=Pontixanthobacter luteolus TaxID=295089 RepID=A0A6I4V203_9SPHN|nr:WcaI family glycosyltransferase [Pontixanthobacter luteolus]
MNILIFGLNYAPEEIGIGPYTSNLAEFMLSRGHEVSVIAGNPYYPEWRLGAGYKQELSEEMVNGVRVCRVPHFIPVKPTGSMRVAHHLSFARNALRQARMVSAADLVLAIAPSLIAAPIALRTAKRFDAVSWLHIQDFEVEAALATGLLSKGPLAKLAKSFERSVVSRFDRVSSISAAMTRKACDKGADPASTIELRNWSEPGLKIDQKAGAELRARLRIPEGRIALYSGNLSLKQGSGLIAEAAQSLARRQDIQFVIRGAGSARPDLERAARTLPNLHVHDLVLRSELGALLSMADIHLLTQIASAADLVLPSKLTNMLASGRPVIATAASGTALAEEIEGCGIAVPPGNGGAFAAAIEQLVDSPEELERLGRAALRRAQERWAPTVLLDQFAVELEKAHAERGSN